MDELKFTIWKEVQDLDLNKRDEWSERTSESDIRRVRHQLQVDNVFFPPTDLDELKDIFNLSTRANRKHDGLEGYLEAVVDFYEDKNGVDLEELVEHLEEIRSSSSSNHELVIERVGDSFA